MKTLEKQAGKWHSAIVNTANPRETEMRIVEWNKDGTPGKAVVKIAVIERMRQFENGYCVVFRLIGVDEDGNPTSHVVTMTKDEIARLNRN